MELKDGWRINYTATKIYRLRLSNATIFQCVSISQVKKNRHRKKLLIFWQKDAGGDWSAVSDVISTRFRFTDIDQDGITEIECIDKKRNRNRRDKYYRLISFSAGQPTEMYAYHQYEYFKVGYIQSNIAPDSVFAVMHKMQIKDIDWDGKPEITDNIEIKFRKLPCCDHHFEYGIREKKLVLRLINGKFELD
jgi:hypothetical protein